MSAFEARHISPNVKKAIFKKIDALNKIGLGGNVPGLDVKAGDTINATPSFDTSVLEPVKKNGKEVNNSLSYQLVRNTFARLSVDIPVKDVEDPIVLSFASYITPKKETILRDGAFAKDELGNAVLSPEFIENPDSFNTFNRFGATTQANTPLAFNKNPMTNDKTFIWRGHTGITSVSVTQKTFFIKEVQVGWECPDPIDFEERVLPFFLQHGRFMVVEFGWGLDSQFDTKVPPITKNNMSKFFNTLQERNNKSVDSYQAEAGTLTNYTYSVTDEGGYKGTMTIVTRGENVLYTPIQNVSDEEETLPSKSFIRTKDTGSINQAVDITRTFRATINNLEDFVTDYLEEPRYVYDTNKGSYQVTRKQYPTKSYDSAGNIILDRTGKRLGSGFQAGEKRDSTRALAIQHLFKNGVMKTRARAFRGHNWNVASNELKLKKLEHIYCSWGWFEDVILNSFFKIDVDTEKGSFPFQEIRSVHTPYRYEISDTDDKDIKFKKNQDGEPSLTDVLDSDDLISNRCNNNENLVSLGFDSIILPGQFFNVAGGTKANLFKDLKRERRFNPNNQKNEKTTRTERNQMNYIYNDIAYLEELEKVIDENFKPFGSKEEGYGYVRNMVFSIDYLKSHFEKINSVEEGLRSLWSDVSAKFGGFFNFYIQQDENNNGRIGIVDGNYLNPIEKDSGLLDFSNEINYEKYIEGKKSLSNPDDMMQFSVFSKDSIISSYSLNLKLTKEAATLALYGSQGKNANGNYTNPSSLYEAGIIKLGALQNAIIPDLQKSGKNLKLGKDKVLLNPILINSFTTPINSRSGRGLDIKEYDRDSDFVSNEFGKPTLRFQDVISISSDITKIKEEQKKKLEEKQKNEEKEEETPKTPIQLQYPTNYDSTTALDTDILRKRLAKINHSRTLRDKSNWSIQKTIIPIELDLTIDGIGGLKPGNLFRIDFLPETYRKYTYFIIMSINHSITTQGWSTSMNAKMKLDFPRMIKDGLIQLEEQEEQNNKTENEVSEQEDNYDPQAAKEVLLSNQEDIVEQGGITESDQIPANSYRTAQNTAGLTLQQAEDIELITEDELKKIEKLRNFQRKLRKQYDIPKNIVFRKIKDGEVFYDALPGVGYSTNWRDAGNVVVLQGLQIKRFKPGEPVQLDEFDPSSEPSIRYSNP